MSLPPLYDESDYEALREEKDKRIAALEAEVECLEWMLREDIAFSCPSGERSQDGIETCPDCSKRLADIDDRYKEREG